MEGSLWLTVLDKLVLENKAETPSLCSIRPVRRTNSIASAFLDEALLGSERSAQYAPLGFVLVGVRAQTHGAS